MTHDGKVRVGWLGLGVESDLQGSMKLDIHHLDRYFKVKSFQVDVQEVIPRIGVSLGKDLKPACFDEQCKKSGEVDAARMTFDMFRYCILLTLSKLMHSSKDTTENQYLHDLYVGTRAFLHPTYVNSSPAGLVMDVKNMVG